jgi:hypothetical protein
MSTWWQGFRGGFGKWIGSSISLLGWFLFFISFVTVYVLADECHHAVREAEITEKVYEEKLMQERKLCKQELNTNQENYVEALKYQREMARREALCNYLKSTWHEGRCFDYEISTDKTYTVRKKVKP